MTYTCVLPSQLMGSGSACKLHVCVGVCVCFISQEKHVCVSVWEFDSCTVTSLHISPCPSCTSQSHQSLVSSCCCRSLYLVCTRFKESVSVSEHEISHVDDVHETLHVSSAPSSLFLGASNWMFTEVKQLNKKMMIIREIQSLNCWFNLQGERKINSLQRHTEAAAPQQA